MGHRPADALSPRLCHASGTGRFDVRREKIGILVRAGDAFENPVSGQQLIFRKTAQDTGGELLEVESIYTKPSPSRPPVHYHPRQEERFEILSGEVHALIDGEERTLREGEVLVIPPRRRPNGTPQNGG